MDLFISALNAKKLVYYGSYLVFPFCCWLLYALYRRPKAISRWLYLLFCVFFIESRFIEPQMIAVRETHIQATGIEASIALIADLHLGVYKSPAFLARVVEKINLSSVDAVLIAGDFIDGVEQPANEAIFSTLFSALSDLNVPVFAVLGNHDVSSMRPELSKDLRLALEKQGVQLIEKKIIDLGTYRIAGLSDRWTGDDSPAFIDQQPSDKPALILAHQPDSALRLSPGNARVLLAGHTHCGQIRIPWLYRRFVPSDLDFDCGLGEVTLRQTTPTACPPIPSSGAGRRGPSLVPEADCGTATSQTHTLNTQNSSPATLPVFISQGLGEIALPLRFLAPPTIDYIHLHR